MILCKVLEICFNSLVSFLFTSSTKKCYLALIFDYSILNIVRTRKCKGLDKKVRENEDYLYTSINELLKDKAGLAVVRTLPHV